MKNLNQVGPDLDLNERINLRGLVGAWLDISVERHQGDLDQKVYGRLGTRTTKKGVERSSLSSRYRFGATRRTRQLHDNWRNSLSGSDDRIGAQYSFLQYGRFLDMGVGKGTDYALSVYQRNRKNGETSSRRPVRWYSKRKGYELHRLRELMVRHCVTIPVETLESALTARIAIPL